MNVGRQIVAVAVAVGAAISVPAVAAPSTDNHPCSAAAEPGGDWTSYGQDSFDSRTQPDEHVIGTANAGQLRAAWTFSTETVGDPGGFNGTPLVADGCVFTASTGGWVYALRADTGVVVWSRHFDVATTGLGGTFVGGPALSHGRLIVIVNKDSAPYVAALDEQTGALQWASAPLSTYPASYSNATPQVFDGVVFAGFSPPEGDSNGVGGFVLLDAADGTTLRTTPTIPPADVAKGYAGGGIWSTPAFDPAAKYAYVGAGNPFSKTVEHPNVNAILKVDLDKDRSTFGQIVAAYKGNVDQYTQALQALSQTPACAETADQTLALDDPVCGQLDLDFGAAPNLFRDATGRLLVGDLQKSGVYHVADATTMKPAWTLTAGLSCQACNAASTAVDGAGVYVEGTPGGVLWSTSHDGTTRWAAPVGDAVHYQAISTANGVVYSIDAQGSLDGWDASSGTPLLRRPMAADAGTTTEGISSAGIAIADHTVFAQTAAGLLAPAAGAGESGQIPAQLQNGSVTKGVLIAYRLP